MKRAFLVYILLFVFSVAFFPIGEAIGTVGDDVHFVDSSSVCSAETCDSFSLTDVVSDYFLTGNFGNSGSVFSFRNNYSSSNSLRILMRRVSGGCMMALRYSDNVRYNSLFSRLVSSQTCVHFGLLSPERYFISLRKLII